MPLDRDNPELDISWRTRELGPKLLIFSKYMTTVVLSVRYVCRLVPGEYWQGLPKLA
jgi:hypothetical protein